MNFQNIIANLTNPTLLFFVLGFIAVKVKSDLTIPEQSIRFISLYLLFSIGFKGGQELSHSSINNEIILSIIFGMAIAALIPLYTFYIAKRSLSIYDAGAVAAAYGSVSAVTFVAASSFLEQLQQPYAGHMVAVMALMESPAIIIGIILITIYTKKDNKLNGKAHSSVSNILHHSVTNGSVIMILGSLIIGIVADSKQAEGIRPFTTDIFKGFLAIFLLEMGMVTARKLSAIKGNGWFITAFAVLVPLLNGVVVAYLSQWVTGNVGNRFMFAVLAASASYIAVPAAIKIAVPQANTGLFIAMALGITFPFNLTIGMPLYWAIVTHSG